MMAMLHSPQVKPALVIVGLGNPGASYERTRHNIGFQAVDILSKSFGQEEWHERQKLLARVQDGRIVTAPVLFVKPLTFVNRSGESVRKILDCYKLDPREQLLVVCDDVDIPLAEVRFRRSGGPGTHNGLRSVVETIGEGFPRIRIGVGAQPPGADLSAWILSVPSRDERAALDSAYAEVTVLVKKFVFPDTEGGVPSPCHT